MISALQDRAPRVTCYRPDYRRSHAPRQRCAGTRRVIEECFQSTKNDSGLDHYQVRSWRTWYARITLAMLAAAHLSAVHAH